MPDTKYIIVENEFGIEVALVFDGTLIHKEVAHRLRAIPVSAGFVYFTVNGARCHGRSESLNLDGRPEDEAIINKSLNIRPPTN